MAKDDYDVLAFKILTYLYACMKHKILFQQETFDLAVLRNGEISTDYLANVLYLMQGEGLIEGLAFIGAWGGDHLLGSNVSDAHITAAGIHYLKENGTMQKVKEAMVRGADIIGNLANLAGLL